MLQSYCQNHAALQVCRRGVMSVLFLLICVVSLVFFAVFLLQCSRPRRASRKAPVVLKLSPTEAVDSAAGRRALIHLQQQMAEFLSTVARVLRPCCLQ